jgi:glycosyltransferase involved in cell wall biosynthesis
MITLSMIVKNEERYLADCLSSVKDVVDEIVIADTGSIDKTIEIAENYGAKVFHYKWNNDFAAARNFALEKSTGEWILYLDADERLTESSISEVKKISAQKNDCAYRIVLRNIDEIGNRPSIMKYARLFPNYQKIRFEGRIHEQIEPSLLRNNFPIKDSNIEILHVGYNVSKESLKAKAKRNLSILLKEYEANPSSYYSFQIGQTHAMLDNSIEAIRYFNEAVESPALRNEYKSVALRYIAINFAEKQDWQNALRSILRSLEYDGEQPIALLAASKIFFNLKKYEDAKTFCNKAYESNRKYLFEGESSYQTICLDEKSIFYEGLNIAICSQDKGLFNFYYQKLKELKGKDTSSQLELIDYLLNNKPITNLEKFKDSVDENNLDFILAILSNYNSESKKNIYKFLYSSFSRFPVFLNQYASFLYNIKEYREAEQILEESYSINSDIPSTVFYLISAYVQNENFLRIKPIIETSEKKFAGQKDIISRFSGIKDKIYPLINTYQ